MGRRLTGAKLAALHAGRDRTAMSPLRSALTHLATTAEDVVVLMRALKIVLELHERRAMRCAANATGRDADEVRAEADEIIRLLPVAADLGRVVTTMMADARAQAEPIVRAADGAAMDGETRELVGACRCTLDFFESTRGSVGIMIQRTIAHLPAGDERRVQRRAARDASGVAEQLLARLRRRGEPGAADGA